MHGRKLDGTVRSSQNDQYEQSGGRTQRSSSICSVNSDQGGVQNSRNTARLSRSSSISSLSSDSGKKNVSGGIEKACCFGLFKYEIPSVVVTDLQNIDRKLRGLDKEVVRLPWADSVLANATFGFLIMLNSICIGVDLELVDEEGRSWPPMTVIESFFLVAFWSEIGIRIFSRGFARFFCDYWGPFDFSVTFIGSLDAWVITPLVGSDQHLSGLTTLRILRLLRLFRLLRIFRHFRELSRIVKVLIGAFQSLLWVSLLLALSVYVSSITTLLLLKGHEGDSAEIKAFTQNLGWTFFYHCTIVTLDTYQSYMVYPTVEITPLWYFYWTPLLVFFNFFLVNSIVGIICGKTITDIKTEDELLTIFAFEAVQFKRTLLQLFKEADINEDGRMSHSELLALLGNTTMQHILDTFGIRNVPLDMLIVILGFQHEDSISFKRLYESCVRVCGASSDIRAFMLQFDVANFHTASLQRIRELGKMLDYVAADGSCHTSIPPPNAPLVVGLPALTKGGEDMINKVGEVDAIDTSITLEVKDGSCKLASGVGKFVDDGTLSAARDAHLEAVTTAAALGPGARSTKSDPNKKRKSKIVCLGHLGSGLGDEFMAIASKAKKRMRALERRQEQMFLTLAELRVALLGECHRTVVCCKAGHPLMPLGTTLQPVGSTEYRQWTCDAATEPSGCRHGVTPGSHLTKLRRYHCAACRYDLCEDCYNVLQSRMGVGRLAPNVSASADDRSAYSAEAKD